MSVQTGELRLPFPLGERRVFRYTAMEDVLAVLYHNPFREYTVGELQDVTDSGSKTITESVRLLEQLDLVRIDTGGRSKNVQLNRDRVSVPENPLFEIPQDEFRIPVRSFVERAQDISDLAGLVVFGSVARGTADRRSDIDLWLLVDDDRLLDARQRATEIAADLQDRSFEIDTGEELTEQRYEFEVLVESLSSARAYDEDLRSILAEGITIIDSETLAELKDDVIGGTVVDVDD